MNIQDFCFLAVVWLGNGTIAGNEYPGCFFFFFAHMVGSGMETIIINSWHAMILFFSTSICPLRSSIASGFL
jgi:hypothetical protein